MATPRNPNVIEIAKICETHVSACLFSFQKIAQMNKRPWRSVRLQIIQSVNNADKNSLKSYVAELW